MNPFDLSGPQFLGFYTLLLFASGLVVYIFWLTLGQRENIRRPMTDPYLIAYLRGGPKEAVKVAAISLAHRGATKVIGATITSVKGESKKSGNALEKAILQDSSTGTSLNELFKGISTEVAKKQFHQRLSKEFLILSDAEAQKALLLKIVLITILVVFAVVKVIIAFQRGRHNILFLLLLAAAGVLVHLKLKLWYTPSGGTAIKDLRVLFKRLKDRGAKLTDPLQNQQFTFLVAVFGVAALSQREHAFLSAFRPKSASNSGCGSSCSSSSSSCSSGCGGGGGCGGCGS